MSFMYFRMGMFLTVLWYLLSGPAVQAADEVRYLYQWKDDRGVVNVTDSLEKVPPKFRSRATQMLQPGAGKEEQRSGERHEDGRTQDLDAATSLDQDESRKAEWQQRIVDAKRRFAEAEALYRSLEQQKKELSEQYGGGVSMVTVQTPKGPVLVPSGAPAMPQEVMDRVKKIGQDMDQAKKEMEDARNEVENVIPDEARKAGIPPGWLREVQ